MLAFVWLLIGPMLLLIGVLISLVMWNIVWWDGWNALLETDAAETLVLGSIVMCLGGLFTWEGMREIIALHYESSR